MAKERALYGLSDERRKEIISLLVHWTIIADDRFEDKYTVLAKKENPEERSPSHWDYVEEHQVDYYAELEATVETMWQERVELDKKNNHE